MSIAEHTYIIEGGAQQEGTVTLIGAVSLGFLLRKRKIWGLTLGFTAYNLFLVWLPGYLQTQLHASVLKIGIYLIIPWLVTTATDIAIGGIQVDRLITRGSNPTEVRKTLFTIGMLLGIAAIGAAF